AYPPAELAAVSWAAGAPASRPASAAPASRPAGAPASRPASAPAGAAPRAEGDPDLLEPVDLAGVTASYVPVGVSGDNVGIVAFNVRRYPQNKMSYEVFLEVQNFRDEPATVRLELLAGGVTSDLRTLQLPARGRVRQIYPDLASAGSRLEARLGRADGSALPLDAFPLDDRAVALMPERRRLKVLLVSEGNLFLEGALLALGGGGEDQALDYDRVRPGAWQGPRPGYDLTIFDAFTPTAAPEAGAYLYLDPRGAGSPFPIRGEVARPVITDLGKHPLARWLTLTDTNISRASVFTPRPGDTVVAASFRQPVFVARRTAAVKLAALGFDLRRSDLPMRPAFPILLANALDWFAGEDIEFMAGYRTGRTWSIAADGAGEEITVTPEGGAAERAPVHDGRAAYYGRAAGYYAVELPRGRTELAANLADPAESTIKPARELVLGGRTLGRPGGYHVSVRRDLWLYLVVAALGLTLIEWWTYHRRITI
ncbi:MAG TPA: VWA domain-containing protein, partial [Polyangia bacterium]